MGRSGGVAVVQGAGAGRGVHMCPGDAGTSSSSQDTAGQAGAGLGHSWAGGANIW